MNAPEKIGKYRITGVIGEGVSGVVYKAFDPSLQRVVAVKSLHRELPVDSRAAQAFVTPLPAPAVLLQVMDQLLDALECAHLSGVRHGDLKPSNVIVTTTGLVKLT